MGLRTFCLGSILFFMLFMPTLLNALTVSEIRELRAKHRLSSLLVFGDSSVDPGNNNRITTSSKSNFLPYGKDFMGGHPTGRFSNGKLASDFVAEALGYAKTVPAFLDPNITKEDLLHAVSFASAGSGYDDLTANLTNTISLTRQIEYFKHYKIHLGQFVGYKKADVIISKAAILMSMGTNDYLQNYFLEPTRPKQFTLDKYQDYLVSRMRHAIVGMHKVGAKRIAVVGVPPLGCMPAVKTFVGDGVHCVDKINKAVLSLNLKIEKEMKAIQTQLNMKTLFIDAYKVVSSAINNPKKYGFSETTKGCCGTGTFEVGDACKGSETCKNPDKYVFWDAVHPSQMLYKILAQVTMKSIPSTFFC
ncbi:GDSL esterase/lipase At5g45950-like isoform X1 [Chenopodium quinoa]|uniref:GDSL esterase/lipase At5g45950-like isoform X1 n=1 Tax=Chenopodium quinoa TaxID=63459 RepID=UPI000B77DCD2|nr:GDSL esterase/lipase At5g45950-like isoform X1 [Chenopodium quinoa]